MWSKQTDRSALNQNRREQLSVTKLIPYLGLHKNSINTWKVCNPMHIAKKGRKKKDFPEQRKRAKEETAAPAISELISSRLKQKARRWDLGACVCACACGHSWWFRQAKEAYNVS